MNTVTGGRGKSRSQTQVLLLCNLNVYAFIRHPVSTAPFAMYDDIIIHTCVRMHVSSNSCAVFSEVDVVLTAPFLSIQKHKPRFSDFAGSVQSNLYAFFM